MVLLPHMSLNSSVVYKQLLLHCIARRERGRGRGRRPHCCKHIPTLLANKSAHPLLFHYFLQQDEPLLQYNHSVLQNEAKFINSGLLKHRQVKLVYEVMKESYTIPKHYLYVISNHLCRANVYNNITAAL